MYLAGYGNIQVVLAVLYTMDLLHPRARNAGPLQIRRFQLTTVGTFEAPLGEFVS